VSTTPANLLPTWGQWQTEFGKLGLSQDEIAKIGTGNLTDAGLAQVFQKVHAGVLANGGVTPTGQTPTTGPTQPPTGTQTTGGAWDAEWDAKFNALGLPGDFVAKLKATAQAMGADDVKIQAVYDKLVKEVGQTSGTQGGAPTEQSTPGWNQDFAARFAQLGMPESVIKLYAESGAPASGLEAAWNHAAGRLADFKDRGWFDKFTQAKVAPEEMWGMILGDHILTDDELKPVYEAAQKKDRSMFARAAQLGVSFFPGGELVQFALGRKIVSGKEIDRTSPINIAFAALSGLALYTSIRGVRNLAAGWSAIKGGGEALGKVGATMNELGLTRGGSSVENVAVGAMQNLGFGAKLKSLIPGTSMHRNVIGVAHAEAAARAFNEGGGAKLLASAGGDGQLLARATGQNLLDIAAGGTIMRGGKIGYLGNLKSAAAMTSEASKGVTYINVSKSMKIGDGRAQLAALAGVSGDMLKDPSFFAKVVPNLASGLKPTAAQLSTLRSTMSGSAVRALGELGTSGGMRASRYLDKVAKDAAPKWYAPFAKSVAAAAVLPGLDEAIVNLHVNASFFAAATENALAAIATHRGAMTPEVAALADELEATMRTSRDALTSAATTGAMTEEGTAALQRFNEVADAFEAADPALGAKITSAFRDEALINTVGTDTLQRLGAARQAEIDALLAAGIDGVPTVPTVDVLSDVLPTSAPVAPSPVPAPTTTIDLTTNARGEAKTGSGLIVPSYTSVAGGGLAVDTTVDPAALQRLMTAARG